MEHGVHLRARSLPNRVCACALLQSLATRRCSFARDFLPQKLSHDRSGDQTPKKLSEEQTFAAIQSPLHAQQSNRC